jgi:ATP-dependent Clp protease ATP-binding subunit ClpB
MRMDKLTNQLQSALADAQSLAVGAIINSLSRPTYCKPLLEQQGGSNTTPVTKKPVRILAD